MKKLIGLFTLAALVATFQAQAAGKGSTASYTSPTTSSSDRKNVISPTLGWMGADQNDMMDGNNHGALRTSGLFGIGAEYEFMLKDDFSVGGFMRYYQSSDSISQVQLDESAFLLGPLVHAYLINTSSWMGYFGTGFTILSLKQKQTPTGGTSTTVSPNLALGIPLVMGVMYKFTDQLQGGIEHMQVMALGSDINGWPVSDIMLRLRIALAN